MERKTLAETMAEELREAILAGVWDDGEALPTEPELAERFGVSRAVVRDATRIVTAWGMVEPRQGKGVFVTGDSRRGFSEALLLAMRREGGSALDVEQVEFMLLPEAAMLAAERRDEVDFGLLRDLLEDYGSALLDQAENHPDVDGFTDDTREAFLRVMTAFYEASGNRLLAFLGPAITRIRTPRHFEDSPDAYPVAETAREIELFGRMIDAVETGDAEAARKYFEGNLLIHEAIRETLAATPVGEVPRIPVSLADLTEGGPAGRKGGGAGRRQRSVEERSIRNPRGNARGRNRGLSRRS